ncbi:EF-hand domain-containing protein [Sphingobium naphthae]|uniref:EF-hand domain-containing protein n=1 Tax=Sphingobium naphthae TaxID=1886786 RepID=A0ABU3ZT48_9SPHN|nr:EF-hand domain-containing protein [Sphingobium naphthae]MDV5822698.1 EF-hand domain-containing protein [Sphingobium naphthae]
MIRAILFTTALALTAPAMAQQTMGADPAMSPATPQTAQPAAPAQPQGATPAQPAPAASVASIVDSEFPAYDANSDGQLDQSEFSRWMVALKSQEMKATGQQLPADQVTAWANGAFSTADADKSSMISKPELITYLSAGA